MVVVWEDKMRVTICLLLSALYVLADKNGNRRTKPFVADAVGNTLPPPSSGPATVGSPINLLTPDRYEFYTFDESGELVKRLMTLEEIQAIVAAGEDSDGLVTFANDNQPTIAFNFSQPPYTKVHSVVTNVQNVLKAQMEAHKNKPLVPPTLDTPDVSDSWSLILPSIFGNSGVDINPDKIVNSYTPETETLEESFNTDDGDNSLSKEGGTQIVNAEKVEDDDEVPTMESIPETTLPSSTTTTSTTTTSTTTTMKPSTTRKVVTTPKPTRTTTSKKLLTTTRPRITTTKLPSSTPKISITTASTTTKNIPRTTTPKSVTTTVKRESTTVLTTKEYISNDIPTNKPSTHFEKISTYVPSSTYKYVTEKATKAPVDITKAPIVYTSTTKRSPTTTTKAPQSISTTQAPKIQTTTAPSTTPKVYVTSVTKESELEKQNLTTLTTQSVSPSTTVSSTENISPQQSQPNFINNGVKDDDTIIPLFDVAQSISQIASDLGNHYQPLPTTSNLLETTKFNAEDMESKENLDIDIPNDENAVKDKPNNEENFVKISTIDPHSHLTANNVNEKPNIKDNESKSTTELYTTTEHIDLTTTSSQTTTIDPILSESMEDLLSQVSFELPKPTFESNDINKSPTTEKTFETTTDVLEEITSDASTTAYELPTTTPKIFLTTKKHIEDLEKQTFKIESTTTPVPLKIFMNNETTLDSIHKVEKNNSDFVQISVSTDPPKKEINNTPVQIPASNNVSDKNTLTQKITTINQINSINFDQKLKQPDFSTTTTIPTTTTITTIAPKTEQTTKSQILPSSTDKPVTQTQVQTTNKIQDDNKIKNTDKIMDTSPKIEEFKKKIQKVNDEEMANDRNDSWKLVPTVTPPKGNDISKDKIKSENVYIPNNDDHKEVVLDFSHENQGLEVTTKDLGEDIAQFTELCNELAFRYWNVMVENIDKRRSFVLSPYSITSMLAMMFMGARGATSGEMNEILKLDDMVTFNPHFTLKNISDSLESSTDSGIAVSAFVRELFSDRTKGKILTFYKERAQHFYSGHVEEINFKLIGDIIRRRTNLLVKKHTWGKIQEYMKTNSIVMKPPLAAFSANIFQTDCTGTSVDGRDGEMYFVVSPNVRQRRLVPVPAVVYKTGFIAGYDPVLDATAAALGNTNSLVSTIFLMPGQQGNIVHAEDLEKLEQRLLETNPTTSAWSRVLRTLLPRVGLELQIPRFSHKSVFNVSSTLREMGLKDLFDADNADLAGLNGPSKDLFLSDMVQMTSFVTCGEGLVGEQHHVEEYPDTLEPARRRISRWADWDEPRDYQRAFHDPHDVGDAMHLPLHLRPRQARLPTRSVQPARLKFDRPFLFFVRHNPSGMILYVGRYNPRLLP